MFYLREEKRTREPKKKGMITVSPQWRTSGNESGNASEPSCVTQRTQGSGDAWKPRAASRAAGDTQPEVSNIEAEKAKVNPRHRRKETKKVMNLDS